MSQPIAAERALAGSALARRTLLAGGLAAVAGLALPRAPRAAALPADRSFAVLRDGREIGRHCVSFAPTADGFCAATEIDIAIKLAFMTVFRFEQTARDLWVDGELLESEATTNDNGEVSRTWIRAAGNSLTVEGGDANRAIRVPLGTMTDLAFWNPQIIRQRALVDIQKVTLTGVAARHLGSEMVEIPGGQIAADRFLMQAEADRSGEVWFDAAGNWVKGTITTRGESLAYRLLG